MSINFSAPRGASQAVTNTTPHNPSDMPLMPTLSGSDPPSKIFNRTTEPANSSTPASSGHIGIVLARCTPPTLAIDAKGPSRISRRAGPTMASTPQTVPATAPKTSNIGVKCAAMAPPDPANIARPNVPTKYFPSRNPLGTPSSPPRTPTTAPSPSIPPNNHTGLAPIAPISPSPPGGPRPPARSCSLR